MTFKFTLSIGLANAYQEDTVEIPDEELEGLSAVEQTAYVEQEWKQWSQNFIDGGWDKIE